MTIDSTGRSPIRPLPWYHASPAYPPDRAASVPDRTVDTARSGRAIPWSAGAGNMRSA